jgi:UDP-N-acetylglucosamine diphosphorylase / glucose-1-phosphate thymidylyltransferase / UDP-N-acetylgalactosamine diphosphorylase / glucosamine-1-phosphate N-acetyltransferase / galactosamine-1-phosphate N-acetyltransferase
MVSPLNLFVLTRSQQNVLLFLLILISYPLSYMNPDLIIENYCERFREVFGAGQSVWDVMRNLQQIIEKHIDRLGGDYVISNKVAIHKTAIVENGTVIKGPAIISAGTVIANHAYLRGGVFIDEKCVIGPGTEIKSSIILSRSSLAHFNFVGDSIIGSDVNFEAGSLIANHYNERTDKTIHILIDGVKQRLSLTKFGAIVGDGSRVGANAVLSPGTLLRKNSVVGRLQLVEQNLI